MKPGNVNLVNFGRTETGYYGTFEISDLGEEVLKNLENGLKLWQQEIKSRGSKIEIKDDKVYLTDYFDEKSFEEIYPSLVGIGMESKLPERISDELLCINTDLAMMEQEVEFTIDMCSMTPEERLKHYGDMSSTLDEIIEDKCDDYNKIQRNIETIKEGGT